jgi:hypothetical protein
MRLLIWSIFSFLCVKARGPNKRKRALRCKIKSTPPVPHFKDALTVRAGSGASSRPPLKVKVVRARYSIFEFDLIRSLAPAAEALALSESRVSSGLSLKRDGYCTVYTRLTSSVHCCHVTLYTVTHAHAQAHAQACIRVPRCSASRSLHPTHKHIPEHTHRAWHRESDNSQRVIKRAAAS